jgi:hypothetical protein
MRALRPASRGLDRHFVRGKIGLRIRDVRSNVHHGAAPRAVARMTLRNRDASTRLGEDSTG